MRVLTSVFVACMASLAAAFPAIFLAYDKGWDASGEPQLLDCSPNTQNPAAGYRCRAAYTRADTNLAGLRRQPQALTMLEILKMGSRGRPQTVVEAVETAAEAAEFLLEEAELGALKEVVLVEQPGQHPFLIMVPKTQPAFGEPKCPPHQVYVAEIDTCEDLDKHAPLPGTPPAPAVAAQKKPVDHSVLITEVGKFEKKLCGPNQLWVPEIDTCVDLDPPPKAASSAKKPRHHNAVDKHT